MGYRQNVQAMCDRLGISNNPRIREEDVRVSHIYFRGPQGLIAKIDGSDMNLASRVFLWDQLQKTSRPSSELIEVDDVFMQVAREFYAELWDDAEEKRRILISALKKATMISIHPK